MNKLFFLCLLLLWLASCSSLLTKSTNRPLSTTWPEISWSRDPKARIVLITYCCDGPIIEDLVRPYIPEAQIWGDGRFIWTSHDGEAARQVFVERLSENELREVLEEIATGGFFEWDEKYEGEPVVDDANQCLTVNLANLSNTVCAAPGGAPEPFGALYDWLTHGAGKEGSLYRPERAYLTGFQLENTDGALPETDLSWPEALAQLPVAAAIKGSWVEEGEALQSMWEAANRSPYHMPVVGDGENRFRIILQVPGVSWIKP